MEARNWTVPVNTDPCTNLGSELVEEIIKRFGSLRQGRVTQSLVDEPTGRLEIHKILMAFTTLGLSSIIGLEVAAA